MDILDMAEDQRSNTLNNTITHIRNTLNNPELIKITHCVDCDCKIPEIRKERMPSAIRCVGCQEIYEGA